MANARKRGNFISSMTVRGVRLDNEEELKEGIESYFKSLFEVLKEREREKTLILIHILNFLQ